MFVASLSYVPEALYVEGQKPQGTESAFRLGPDITDLPKTLVMGNCELPLFKGVQQTRGCACAQQVSSGICELRGGQSDSLTFLTSSLGI